MSEVRACVAHGFISDPTICRRLRRSPNDGCILHVRRIILLGHNPNASVREFEPLSYIVFKR